jgi:hypothetical protein
VESRLEIALAVRPRGFRVPNYKIYKYEHSEGLAVVFEVETRLIKRYIPPHCDFDILEIERTDYLPVWMHTGTGSRYEGVIYECIRRKEDKINMLMLVTNVLLIISVTCALIMMLVIYWRIFVLLQVVTNQIRHE